MNNSNDNIETKLKISFPKSKEDHRLQLVEINGSIFAIVHAPLESLGPIRLDCEVWSLVLLAPIKSKTTIEISAINVISLNEIVSEEGSVKIEASNRLVKFTHSVKAADKVCEKGEGGKFQFEDDPGAFLYYYQLFDGIVRGAREGGPLSYSAAQQKFIACLCTLANKIDKKSDNLNLQKILGFWDISYLNS